MLIGHIHAELPETSKLLGEIRSRLQATGYRQPSLVSGVTFTLGGTLYSAFEIPCKCRNVCICRAISMTSPVLGKLYLYL